MGEEQGGVGSPSDVDLLRLGCALSDAHAVSTRCASCGSYSTSTSDGVRYLVARAFATGYRLRELGAMGCSEWLAEGPRGSPAVADVWNVVCELGLGEGRHAYASSDGRSWTCPCGSSLTGTRVTFAWPRSPLDGQTYVVTDAQLEELGQSGMGGTEEILASARLADRTSANRRP